MRKRRLAFAMAFIMAITSVPVDGLHVHAEEVIAEDLIVEDVEAPGEFLEDLPAEYFDEYDGLVEDISLVEDIIEVSDPVEEPGEATESAVSEVADLEEPLDGTDMSFDQIVLEEVEIMDVVTETETGQTEEMSESETAEGLTEVQEAETAAGLPEAQESESAETEDVGSETAEPETEVTEAESGEPETVTLPEENLVMEIEEMSVENVMPTLEADGTEAYVEESKPEWMSLGTEIWPDIPEILLNTGEIVSVDSESCSNFSFTPTESGMYIFESYDASGDPYAYIHCYSEGNVTLLAEDDDSGEDNNFMLSVYMQEGNAYYIGTYGYGYSEAKYKIRVFKAPAVQTIEQMSSLKYTKLVAGVDEVDLLYEGMTVRLNYENGMSRELNVGEKDPFGNEFSYGIYTINEDETAGDEVLYNDLLSGKFYIMVSYGGQAIWNEIELVTPFEAAQENVYGEASSYTFSLPYGGTAVFAQFTPEVAGKYSIYTENGKLCYISSDSGAGVINGSCYKAYFGDNDTCIIGCISEDDVDQITISVEKHQDIIGLSMDVEKTISCYEILDYFEAMQVDVLYDTEENSIAVNEWDIAQHILSGTTKYGDTIFVELYTQDGIRTGFYNSNGFIDPGIYEMRAYTVEEPVISFSQLLTVTEVPENLVKLEEDIECCGSMEGLIKEKLFMFMPEETGRYMLSVDTSFSRLSYWSLYTVDDNKVIKLADANSHSGSYELQKDKCYVVVLNVTGKAMEYKVLFRQYGRVASVTTNICDSYSSILDFGNLINNLNITVTYSDGVSEEFTYSGWTQYSYDDSNGEVIYYYGISSQYSEEYILRLMKDGKQVSMPYPGRIFSGEYEIELVYRDAVVYQKTISVAAPALTELTAGGDSLSYDLVQNEEQWFSFMTPEDGRYLIQIDTDMSYPSIELYEKDGDMLYQQGRICSMNSADGVLAYVYEMTAGKTYYCSVYVMHEAYSSIGTISVRKQKMIQALNFISSDSKRILVWDAENGLRNTRVQVAYEDGSMETTGYWNSHYDIEDGINDFGNITYKRGYSCVTQEGNTLVLKLSDTDGVLNVPFAMDPESMLTQGDYTITVYEQDSSIAASTLLKVEGTEAASEIAINTESSYYVTEDSYQLYSFTPTKTEEYRLTLRHEGDGYPNQQVFSLTETGCEIVYGTFVKDDGTSRTESYNLNEGKTYYCLISGSSYCSGTGTVTISEKVRVTSLAFVYPEMDTYSITDNYQEELAETQIYVTYSDGSSEIVNEWSSTYYYDAGWNKRVYYASVQDGDCGIYLKLLQNEALIDMPFYTGDYLVEGKYIIKAYVQGNEGINAVKEIEITPLQNTLDLYSGGDWKISVQKSDPKYLKFTPDENTAGYYTLYSHGSTGDVRVNLYESPNLSEYGYIDSDDDGAGYPEFKLTRYLEAGKTYYYKIDCYNKDLVKSAIRFEKLKDISEIKLKQASSECMFWNISDLLSESEVSVTYEDGTKEVLKKWDREYALARDGNWSRVLRSVENNGIYLSLERKTGDDIWSTIDIPYSNSTAGFTAGEYRIAVWTQISDVSDEADLNIQYYSVESNAQEEITFNDQERIGIKLDWPIDGTFVLEMDAVWIDRAVLYRISENGAEYQTHSYADDLDSWRWIVDTSADYDYVIVVKPDKKHYKAAKLTVSNRLKRTVSEIKIPTATEVAATEIEEWIESLPVTVVFSDGSQSVLRHLDESWGLYLRTDNDSDGIEVRLQMKNAAGDLLDIQSATCTSIPLTEVMFVPVLDGVEYPGTDWISIVAPMENSIALTEEKNVSLGNEEWVTYTFEAEETGQYVFGNYHGTDTYVRVYTYNPVTQTVDWVAGGYNRISKSLTPGTYYFVAGNRYGEPDEIYDFNLMLRKDSQISGIQLLPENVKTELIAGLDKATIGNSKALISYADGTTETVVPGKDTFFGKRVSKKMYRADDEGNPILGTTYKFDALEEGTYYLAVSVKDAGVTYRDGILIHVTSQAEASVDYTFAEGSDLLEVNGGNSRYICASYTASSTGWHTFATNVYLYSIRIFDSTGKELEKNWQNDHTARAELVAGETYSVGMRRFDSNPFTLQILPEKQVQNAELLLPDTELIAGMDSLDVNDMIVDITMENGEQISVSGEESFADGTGYYYEIVDTETGEKVEVGTKLKAGTYQVTAVQKVGKYRSGSAIYRTESAIASTTVSSAPKTFTVKEVKAEELAVMPENQEIELKATGSRQLFSFIPSQTAVYTLESETGLEWQLYLKSENGLEITGPSLVAGQSYVLSINRIAAAQYVRMTSELTVLLADQTNEITVGGYDTKFMSFTPEKTGIYRFAGSCTKENAEYELFVSGVKSGTGTSEKGVMFTAKLQEGVPYQIGVTNTSSDETVFGITITTVEKKQVDSLSIEAVHPEKYLLKLIDMYSFNDLFDITVNFTDGISEKVKAGETDKYGKKVTLSLRSERGDGRVTFLIKYGDYAIPAQTMFATDTSVLPVLQKDIWNTFTIGVENKSFLSFEPEVNGKYYPEISGLEDGYKLSVYELYYNTGRFIKIKKADADCYEMKAGNKYLFCIESKDAAEGTEFEATLHKRNKVVGLELVTPSEPYLGNLIPAGRGMVAIAAYADGMTAMVGPEYGNVNGYDSVIESYQLTKNSRLVYLKYADYRVSCVAEEMDYSLFPSLSGNTEVDVTGGEKQILTTFVPKYSGYYSLVLDYEGSMDEEPVFYNPQNRSSRKLPAFLEEGTQYVLALYISHAEDQKIHVRPVCLEENCGTGFHTFEDYVSNDDATCMADGTKTAVCEGGCGATDTIPDEGSIKDHEYAEYVYDGNATDDTAGTETAFCTYGCGESDTRPAADLAEGTCGSNLTWVLRRNGTLYISGEGSMSSFTSSTQPWSAYQTEIKKAVIAEGVTGIGAYAFYRCTNLEEVSIPDSVRGIGEYAFYSCDNLNNVVLPEGITSVNRYTFYGCSSMRNLTLPSTLETIGAYAFGEVVFGDLVIPEGVTAIQGYAFYIARWDSLVLPSTLTTMGEYVFSNSGAVRGIVTTPEGLISIPNGTYCMCGNLTGIVIRDGVQSIGNNVFRYCGNLKEVWIPESVTYIGSSAFYGLTPSEITIYGYADTEAEAYASANGYNFVRLEHVWDDGTVTVEATCSTSGERVYTCNDCSASYTEVIPADGITHLYEAYHHNNDAGCTENGTETAECEYGCGTTDTRKAETGALGHTYDDGVVTAGPTCSDAGEISYTCTVCGDAYTEVIPADGITHLYEEYHYNNDATCASNGTKTAICAYGCGTTDTVEEENSIVDHNFEEYVYDDNANDNTSGTETAFCTYGCGESDTRPAADLAEGTCGSNLTWVLRRNGTLYISGEGSMSSFTSSTQPWSAYQTEIEKAVIAEGVTGIGSYAFYRCMNLEEVSIPDSVRGIGEYAFYSCDSLNNVVLPEGITSVNRFTFYGCSAMRNLSLPSTLETIGAYAFGEVVFGDLVIPEGVTAIQGYAFYIARWDSLMLPSTLTTMGEYVFSNSGAIKGIVTTPEGLISIPNGTYCMCGNLKGVVIRDGVQSIGNNVFRYCGNLKEVWIPESVTYIGSSAFYGLTPSEITIYGYAGTAAETYALTKGYNFVLLEKEEPADKTELEAVVTNIESSVLLENEYSETSWKNYISMLMNAKEVLADEAASQEAIDQAADALVEAYEALEKHVWDVGTVTVEATCSTSGERVYTCTGCGASYTEVIPADGVTHRFAKYKANGDANCTENGTETAECMYGCGATDTRNAETGALGHAYDDGAVTVKPTCIKEGVFTYSCTECEHSYTETIPADGITHLFEEYESNHDATCTKDGTKTAECAYGCGTTDTVEEENSIAGHNFEEYVYDDNASDDTSGTETAFCTYGCGQFDTRPASNLVEGSCGSNLTWILRRNGTLFISGEGSMNSFTSSTQPWAAYQKEIKKAVIEEGITGIGAYAFYRCVNLEEVSIPDSVRGIGEYAFYSCSSLNNVVIPEGITSVNRFTFYGCSSMRNLSLPSTLETIGAYAFGEVVFGDLVIPEGVTAIQGYAFYIARWDSLVLPSTLTSMGEYVFSNSGAIKGIVITPEGLISIPNGTYCMCGNLTGVVIRDGVQSIGNNVFRYCGNLEEVWIPESVTYISSSAFYGLTPSEITIYGYAGTKAETYADQYGFKFVLLEKEGIVNKNVLQDAVLNIELAGLTETDYCAASWSEFRASLTAAKAILADEKATQESVDQAADDLQSVYDVLNMHVWDEGLVTLKATCCTVGERTYSCTDCEVEYTEVIPADGITHKFVRYTANGDATCTGHGTETAVCSYGCGKTDTRNAETGKLNHTYDAGVITVLPDCSHNGILTYSCTVCGDFYTEEIFADGVTHLFAEYKYDDNATCEADGTETAKCDNCSETNTRSVRGTALGHSYTHYTSNRDATCFEDGTKSAVCDRENCDSVDTQIEEGSKRNHVFVTYVPDGNANCISHGTETAVCENGCGITNTREASTGATGHSFTQYMSNDDATCEADGTETAKCDNCSETNTRINTDSRTGHLYEDAAWNIVTPATCTANGQRIRYCENSCGAYETEVLPAVGHDFSDQELITENATEDSDGKMYYLCANGCGEMDIVAVLVNPVVQEAMQAIADSMGTGNAEIGSYVDAIKEIDNQDLINSIEVTDQTGAASGINGMELVKSLEQAVKTDANSSDETPNVGDSMGVVVNNSTGEITEDKSIAIAGAAVTVASAINEATETSGDSLYQAGETYHAQLAIQELSGEPVMTAAMDDTDIPENTDVYLLDIHMNIVDSKNNVVEEHVPLAAPVQITIPVQDGVLTENTTLYHFENDNEDPVAIRFTPNPDGTITFCTPSFSMYSLENEHRVLQWNTIRQATCTQAGLQTGTCIGCRRTVEQDVEMVLHSYGEEQCKKATCSQAGEKYRECSACGRKERIEILPATGEHSYETVGNVMKTATCTEDGVRRFACTSADCDAFYDEVIRKGHSYETSYTTDVQATCISPGMKSIHCTKCDAVVNETEIPMIHHVWKTSGRLTKAPTCTETGEMTFACTQRGCSAVDKREVEAKGHTFNNYYTEDVKATCISSGSKSRHCADCDETTGMVEIPATNNHNYIVETDDKQAATCISEGWIVYQCDTEKCTATNKVTLNVIEHEYGDFEIVKNATCTENGSRTKYCQYGCGASFGTETIPAEGHEPEVIIDLKETCGTDGSQHVECLNCDYVGESTAIPATGNHSLKTVVDQAATCGEAGSQHKECTNCTHKEPATAIPATNNHSLKTVVDQAATCGAAGSQHKECTNCTHKEPATAIPATGNHSLKTVVDKAATCGAAGSQHKECANCTYKETATAIPATGNHSLKTVVDQAATCGAAGSQHKECTNCTHKEPATAIPATGNHSLKTVVDQAATCGAAGSQHVECTNCTYKEAATAISATGNHSLKTVVDQAATCGAAGSQHKECTNCTYKEAVTAIPATGNHSLKTVVDTEATCGAEGSQHKECTNCTYKEAATAIAATGNHSLKTVVDQEATCGEAGSQHEECTVCGHKEKATSIAATGNHTFKDYQVTKEPTVTAEGSETGVCSVCQETDTRQVEKLEGRIKLSASTLKVQLKKSVKMSQLIKDMDETDSVVSWKSSNTKVATIKKNGTLKAKKTGKTTITVTLASGVSAKVKVTVQKKAVKTSKIQVVNAEKTITLKKGKKFTLQTLLNPISSQEKIKYSTSNKKKVTVSSKGQIKAKAKGKATITIQAGKAKTKITVIVK